MKIARNIDTVCMGVYPFGLLQSRAVPVIWDNKRKKHPIRELLRFRDQSHCYPLLAGNCDRQPHKQPTDYIFYSVASTLLKASLTPRSPVGLTIRRTVLVDYCGRSETWLKPQVFYCRALKWPLGPRAPNPNYITILY